MSLKKTYLVKELTKAAVIILFTSMLSSCKENLNNTKPDNNTQKQETNPNISIKNNQEQLFFQAQGNEPGWQLTINKKSDVLNYILEFDHKEIQKQGITDLKRLDNSNYGIFELLNEKNKTEVKFKKEECLDMAGNTHKISVIVKHNGKLYLGCGDFLVNTTIENELKSSNEIDHYICYSNDNRKEKKIWVGFNKNDIALKIKYEGQEESMELEYLKNEYQEGGTHPTIRTYYNEIYGGQVNGVYKTIHSGNWDYVEYTRGKDNKVFKFTIEHKLNPYGSKPCF
ncbi:hypothetical protein [Wenyingzhuangia sp. 2_MG-2023]|uniref:hypothetical protein n=1 Tax=Wenyingzhuangia sp. 2_MG-2023 TaxID=3062639 RepID=UPI0026E18829|nr:hypothetical protein [Wenyingzhuangia sp. 2_MG-2023]MDO6738684.1 hypothetical protein [Wenyingzhuangia sp. 2_MG-2023]